jgi:Putative Flp pilus-assembly TadE/G-like
MNSKLQARTNRHDDRGVSILIIAVSMVFVLGMAGLGIDLASLYVGRSQAQRAADAAALAGARALVGANNESCVNGGSGSISSACMAVARQQAEAVGNQNLVAGVVPAIGDADITFPSTSVNDPQIQVIASRDSSHNNPMPTFFIKIFGISTANVSAKAVAEAYSSNGSGPQVGAQCVKPWLIPNCDPGNTSGTVNPLCNNSTPVGGFVIPQSGGLSSTLARGPVQAPSGPLGEGYTLKPGSPGGAAAPGQYYAAYIPTTTQFATECPACASQSPGGGGTGSAAVYRSNIECCNNTPIVCGSNSITLQSTAGNMVGPTRQGVDCLIHQSGSNWSSNCGQDRMGGISNPCAGPPPAIMTDLSITAGPNNPYLNAGTNVASQNSDSVVALPIWDGTPLQSGQNSNVNIVGFLQLFIQSEGSPQGSVYGTVLGVTACGSGGSGSGGSGGTGPIVASGGSSIPVRLIHD